MDMSEVKALLLLDLVADVIQLLRSPTASQLEAVRSRIDQLNSMLGGTQVQVSMPEFIAVKAWLEDKDAYYRNREGVATSSGFVYEEVMDSNVRIMQFLAYIDIGGRISLWKNGTQIFPTGDSINIHNAWIVLNPPSRIGRFEKGSKLQVRVDVDGGMSPSYKFILIGVVE